MLFCIRRPNFVQINRLRRSNDVSVFEMAAATAQCYFRLRFSQPINKSIYLNHEKTHNPFSWRHCLQIGKIYQQTKFRWHVSIHGWEITTSGLKNICHLGILLPVQFWPHHCNWHVIAYHAAKLHLNWTTRGGHMTSYRFSRWQMSAILNLLWGNDGLGPKICRWSD